ncbi:hypothetical protein BFS35_008260 [Macrococcoides goetzii]|uniref:Uncharacterized protein n=1 Tax=Macrococcoides goetzii TaxID=1891097 RepID=A0A395G9U3_9STAP|nr:hypothetical protein [Macrococcus goetzii]RAI80423.1 hypothetical protein BFS35_008260 [Macrococcus goetzii]
MKITKLAVSAIIATSLTLPALSTQVDASATTVSVQKMSEKAFNNKVQTVKKEYTKIPVNIRAGYYINPQKQTITVVIKNLTKNVKYKNGIIKKFGKNNLIFKTALYSEQGLVKAKNHLEKYIDANNLKVVGYGTDIMSNKVYVQVVNNEKRTIKLLTEKFKSAAYQIEIISPEQAPRTE